MNRQVRDEKRKEKRLTKQLARKAKHQELVGAGKAAMKEAHRQAKQFKKAMSEMMLTATAEEKRKARNKRKAAGTNTLLNAQIHLRPRTAKRGMARAQRAMLHVEKIIKSAMETNFSQREVVPGNHRWIDGDEARDNFVSDLTARKNRIERNIKIYEAAML
jgi:septum formation inhibitor MinC